MTTATNCRGNFQPNPTGTLLSTGAPSAGYIRPGFSNGTACGGGEGFSTGVPVGIGCGGGFTTGIGIGSVGQPQMWLTTSGPTLFGNRTTAQAGQARPTAAPGIGDGIVSAGASRGVRSGRLMSLWAMVCCWLYGRLLF